MRPIISVALLATALGLAGCGKAYAAAAPAPKAQRPVQAKKAEAAPIQQATPAEAAKIVATTPGVQFVDVRTPEEYAEGRAKGAANRPLDQLPQWAGTLKPDQPVVLICRSGSRSMKAATALAEKGFSKLVNVQGGTMGWEAEGLPLEK